MYIEGDVQWVLDYVRLPQSTMALSVLEASFIGTVFEGIIYGKYYFHDITNLPTNPLISSVGLYCVVFILYIRIHTRKEIFDRNLLVYPLSALFVLCTVFFALDFTEQFLTIVSLRHLLY